MTAGVPLLWGAELFRVNNADLYQPTQTATQLTAGEALDIGLVTEVVADDALTSRAEELARQLVELPTQALSATKRLVWSGLGASVVDQRRLRQSHLEIYIHQAIAIVDRA